MSIVDLAFIQQIGFPGLVVILIIALVVFGKRLPEVARSLGKGIVEFKKGVRGIEDEVDTNVHKPKISPRKDDDDEDDEDESEKKTSD